MIQDAIDTVNKGFELAENDLKIAEEKGASIPEDLPLEFNEVEEPLQPNMDQDVNDSSSTEFLSDNATSAERYHDIVAKMAAKVDQLTSDIEKEGHDHGADASKTSAYRDSFRELRKNGTVDDELGNDEEIDPSSPRLK